MKLKGMSVSSGIAIGPVLVLKDAYKQIERTTVKDAEAEIVRVRTAIDETKKQVSAVYNKTKKEVGEEGAAIFAGHQMILEDEDYLDAIHHMIRTEMINAECAVSAIGAHFSELFARMDDDYMKARAVDVKDVSDRLVRNLAGQNDMDLTMTEPSVIVAEDLSPSETVQLDRDKVIALVTVHGSTNSHTAILARMMNIPTVVGVPVDWKEIHSGMKAIVDGSAGEVIFNPTEAECSKAEERRKEEKLKFCLLQELKGKESITTDGRKINISANINSVCDVEQALENDAEGIGLFRSEFLYLEREDFPTEEEQFQAYKQVVQTMGEKRVIIRTLDIGADKQADYFNLEKEENSALGYRAIRICLKQTELFKTQLRALFRAAAYGNLAVLYPMIISTQEVDCIYEIAREAERELKDAKIPYKVPKQGIMIETPAAVMISDELAEMVDFFSIGTNDLTQYTLAIDRQNQKIQDFYNPHHKAILRMIKLVVDNAHKCGKWVGICGELGADTALTETFVNMGIDELSVAPSMVLKVREKVRAI